MATLTQTSIVSRKIFNTIVFFLGIAIISFIVWKYGKTLVATLFPPPPPPATVAFGKIPRLDTSESVKAAGVTYTLETISGDLPELPDKAKVFWVKGIDSFFGALERTKLKVSGVGFSAPPTEISGNIAKFLDIKDPKRVMTINFVTGNFKLDGDVTGIKVKEKKPASIEAAVDLGRNFLKKMEVEPSEFSAKYETLNFKIDQGKLVEVEALFYADLVQVNFTRSDIDKIPVYSPRHREAPIKLLVSGSDVIAGEVDRANIERNKFSTYPLKEVSTAYKELKEGKGVFNREVEGNRFPIRDVALGYLEVRNHQGFFQPVYVFKSDHGLYGFVTAVDDAWIRE